MISTTHLRTGKGEVGTVRRLGVSTAGSAVARLASGPSESRESGAVLNALTSDHLAFRHGGSEGRARLVMHLQAGYGNRSVGRALARRKEASVPASAIPESAPEAAPAAGPGAGATAGCCCPPEPVAIPPVAPNNNPEFAGVASAIGTVGEEQRAHPPAVSQADEAQSAAVPPANEVQTRAQGDQVGEMAEQKPGVFDKAAFVASVRKAIADAAPKNMDEADRIKDSGKASQVKQEVGAVVDANKDATRKDIKGATEAPPDTSKVTPKPVTPMAPTQPGPAPGSVGAGRAVPPAKIDAETSLQHGKCEVEGVMAQANVTEEQLARSNEPTFHQALDARGRAAEFADTAPPRFRQDEAAALDAARNAAGGTAEEQLAAMHRGRAEQLGQVGDRKASTKTQDETFRVSFSTELEAIYNSTKKTVETILNGLDPMVSAAFDEGEKAARTGFEDYVKQKMDDFRNRRYGWLFGWAVWLVDMLFGLPGEVNDFINQARDRYLADMDRVIDRIADQIGAELPAP